MSDLKADTDWEPFGDQSPARTEHVYDQWCPDCHSTRCNGIH